MDTSTIRDDEINVTDIDEILVTMKYAKKQIMEMNDEFVPLNLKNEKLTRIEKIEAKLRNLRIELIRENS